MPKSVNNSTIQQALAEAAAGVALRSVTKKYSAVTAVENLTLDITAGTYCCLLGPSGCGKTTAIRMVAGHEDITIGDILVGDRVKDKCSFGTISSQSSEEVNISWETNNCYRSPHSTSSFVAR